MRTEQEIFADLEALCTSRGYAHALAYLCRRDFFVSAVGVVTPKDIAARYSWDRLIRTEVATIAGLMIKGPIDCGVQAQTALRTQITATKTLLRELHDSFNAPMMEHFKSPDALRSGANPFPSGKFLREAIFYCSESAYPFQYRDFAPEKYKRDEEWLLRKMGFAIPDAVRVMGLIKSITEARMLRLPDTDEDAALTANYLQAFTFSRDEIVRASGLAEYLG